MQTERSIPINCQNWVCRQLRINTTLFTSSGSRVRVNKLTADITRQTQVRLQTLEPKVFQR